MRLPQSNDLLRHFARGFERRRARSARLVDESLDATLLETRNPLVRRLATDAVRLSALLRIIAVASMVATAGRRARTGFDVAQLTTV